MLPGISGALISSDFLERLLFEPLGGRLGGVERDGIKRRLVRWWRLVEARYGPASSGRAILDGAALPLAEALGCEPTRVDRAGELFVVSLTHAQFTLPLLVVPWHSLLDAAWRPALRQGVLHQSAWCLLYSGSRLRVLDVAHAHARRHLEFDLPLVFGHDAALDVFASLMRPEHFEHRATTVDSLLAQIVDASDQHGVRVCSALRAGVVTATERMLAAIVDDASVEPARLDRVELQDEAMTAVYRMLFLLFAEARTLVPSWHTVYRTAYSLEALRDTAEREQLAPGLSEALQAIGRLAHAGCHAGDLIVTAFNGRLFSPARAPRLDTGRLDDEVVRQALLAVSTFVPRGESRRHIAFADLGVEELGAVYEGLLEYETHVDAVPAAKGSRAASRVVVRFERTGTARRKATGTFYTPRALTRYLVRETLAPLTRDKTPEAILALRICDPAMGSGAFLVAACHYLAQAYEASLLETGSCVATDLSEHDRAGFRRLIAQRCLFGVDLNPMAVQLARLSLWLTTLAADQPLTFLDHHLIVGDSLLGAGPLDLLRSPFPRQTSGDRQLPLFDASELARLVSVVLPVRHHLERTADTTAAAVRAKEEALASLDAHEDLRRWRAACDVWCSNWCMERPLAPGTLRALLDAVLHDPGPTTERAARRHLERVGCIATERSFHHWALQFPEVFSDERGSLHDRLGFDAIIGNPPWEMLRADEGARAEERYAPVLRFARTSGLYTARSVGHSNLYQLFVERAVALSREGGRLGLVIPGGFALDASAAALRRRLLYDCDLDGLVGFENRSGVFPIHRSMRFLLVTGSRGGRTHRIRCRFGLQDPSELETLESQVTGRRDLAFPVSITPSLLERLTGEDLAIPYVRTPIDLQIAERLACTCPRLGTTDGWNARFGRELNATDHREHFKPEPPFDSAQGAPSDRRGARGLPVLEGKHILPYIAKLDDASLRIDPRRAATLLDPAVSFGVERLAFRDVASATNRQTVIAAILPARCVTTHTLFCLKSRLPLGDQRVLCLLLNSYVLNFLVRQRVSSHVTVAVMHTIPVPRPAPGSAAHREMSRVAALLARERRGRQAVLARAHALAARVYALDEDEYRHVLSTFPLVPVEERQAALEEFRRLWQSECP